MKEKKNAEEKQKVRNTCIKYLMADKSCDVLSKKKLNWFTMRHNNKHKYVYTSAIGI